MKIRIAQKRINLFELPNAKVRKNFKFIGRSQKEYSFISQRHKPRPLGGVVKIGIIHKLN